MSTEIELAEPKVFGYKIKYRRADGAWIERDHVPPNVKTSPGSRLSVDAKGKVSYSNRDCIKDWRPGSRPFKAPEPRGRQSDSETVFD